MNDRDYGSGSIAQDTVIQHGSPVLIRMADVQPESVDWLWPGRFPIGKLTMIVGDPGLGKSFLTVDMAARVSTGAAWPDGAAETRAPGGVVMLSAEDDPADTIRPRLDAAAADCERIVMVQAVNTIDPQSKRSRQKAFNLADDLPALERAIEAVPRCRLVIVDPVSAYLGETDSHANSDVRGVLHPLSELAAKNRVAIVAVSHLNKSAGTRAIHRTMGSVAFVAAARAAYLVAGDKVDGNRRLLLPLKNNLAADSGGLAFRLGGESVPRIEWEPGTVTMSADEALEDDRGGKGGRERRNRAEEFFRGALAGGPKPAADVIAEGQQLGIGEKALRRALGEIGFARKTGFDGGWVWELRDEEPSEDAQDAPSS